MERPCDPAPLHLMILFCLPDALIPVPDDMEQIPYHRILIFFPFHSNTSGILSREITDPVFSAPIDPRGVIRNAHASAEPDIGQLVFRRPAFGDARRPESVTFAQLIQILPFRRVDLR